MFLDLLCSLRIPLPPPLSILLRGSNWGQSPGKIEVFLLWPSNRKNYTLLIPVEKFSCLLKDGGQRSGSATGHRSDVLWSLAQGHFSRQDACQSRSLKLGFPANHSVGEWGKWLLSCEVLKERSWNISKPLRLSLAEISLQLLAFFWSWSFLKKKL